MTTINDKLPKLPWKSPKEVVMSAIALVVTLTFCYGLATELVDPDNFQTIVIMVMSFYFSTKAAQNKPQ